MSDITRYARTRAARNSEFADDLEPGYAEFKAGALLRQAREQAGFMEEEVAAVRNPKVDDQLDRE